MLNDGWKVGQLLTAIAQSCHVCRHFDEPQALLVWLNMRFNGLCYCPTLKVNILILDGKKIVSLLCIQR